MGSHPATTVTTVPPAEEALEGATRCKVGAGWATGTVAVTVSFAMLMPSMA
eukprot:CAMPEP_0173464836 /NCGR_PEP_ID=MMETSP1357-20121228/70607_1 /TAXON_ID=77926 /ORGANISM="Hemiselmis rufescens, Strain PCC563" /LENGTH=50 /DNA_ID=CAMNT_0014432767 /DNA_START=25 /DNA_END=174 /DNA_ORIENTATION=+